MTRLHHAVLLAVTILASCLVRTARAGEDYDNWYVVRLNEQRAGWAHMMQRSTPDEIVSITEMELAIRRDRATMTIRFDTEFTESRDGTPLHMRVVITNSNVPVEGVITFTDEGMVVSENGIQRTLPLPEGKWLAPAASNDYVASRLAAGAERIVYRVLEPQLTNIVPTATTNTITDIEDVNVEALGRTVPGYRGSMESSSTPGLTLTQFFDARGQTIRQIIPMGGSMKMEIVIADRDLALAEVDAPELMRGTLVKPNVPIRRPRDLERAVYVVRAKGETLPDVPSTGFQTVERLDERSARVTVDLSKAEAASPPTDEVTAPSRMLDSKDPEIIRLVREACDGVEGPEPRARAMRRFVRRHITSKNLGVGLASASEVA
ncbi:MAG: hypothetical protein KDA28_11180, partial [Phycisphaerales bacterium]|nr:hypothetical protein [Phycisphaerales bacterium]